MQSTAPKAIIAALAIMILPLTAAAPPPTQPTDRTWSIRDVGNGCRIVLRDRDIMLNANGASPYGQLFALVWEGACNTQGLAEGQGALVAYSKNLTEEARLVLRGSLSNGLLQGRFVVEEQVRQNTAAQWQTLEDANGIRIRIAMLSSGCETADDSSYCDPNMGGSTREAFLTGQKQIAALPVGKTNVQPPYRAASGPDGTVTKPKLSTNMGPIFARNYPAGALTRGEEGKVGFRLTISPTGAVSNCTITQSSGFSSLDSKTCDLWRANAKFKPALDNKGKAVESGYSSSIQWKIP